MLSKLEQGLLVGSVVYVACMAVLNLALVIIGWMNFERWAR